MDARVSQFLTDAQRPRDIKTAKDIAKLRSFLFKNQAYRFTDSEQQRLFQTIGCYVTMYSSSSTPEQAGDSPALGLVEDALKMPFTVFTTGQKKSMLKWLEKLKEQEAAAAAADGCAGADTPSQWTLLDLTDSSAEVMDAEGDTQQVELGVCDPDLVGQLRALFASEAEVLVQLGVRHGKTAITRLLQQ